ncbi:MAG: hypothetical protein Q8Q60_00500 [Candidatus Chromulinivorax sp.]|nr:hypothetical protein [Candidatus Chromulinivorax sp.]
MNKFASTLFFAILIISRTMYASDLNNLPSQSKTQLTANDLDRLINNITIDSNNIDPLLATIINSCTATIEDSKNEQETAKMFNSVINLVGLTINAKLAQQHRNPAIITPANSPNSSSSAASPKINN